MVYSFQSGNANKSSKQFLNSCRVTVHLGQYLDSPWQIISASASLVYHTRPLSSSAVANLDPNFSMPYKYIYMLSSQFLYMLALTNTSLILLTFTDSATEDRFLKNRTRPELMLKNHPDFQETWAFLFHVSQ